MSLLHVALLAFSLALSPSTAHAGAYDEDLDWHLERENLAEQSFQTIMQANEAPVQAAPARSRPAPATPATVEAPPPPVADPATVTVDLDRWEAARRALSAAQQAEADLPEHLVVLGASTYRGRAISGGGEGGALDLTLDLQVTLHGEGLWKTVPLVGEDVVVVGARANGKAVPLSSRNGYHVWVTQQAGEVTLSLDLLVPSRGRRGSLEYELLVAKTPVTRFSCDFPAAGLEPRLRGAVQAEVSGTAEGTRLDALLEPTSRIHLVGFRDMGQDEGREARVYAESMSLLSLDESTHELFTVVRYNILYAGQRQFDIAIPAGTSVVSADGQGAFRYRVEPATDGAGSVLRGETAYPISGSYELSLRLRRDDAGSGEPFTVGLPRSLGVEREYGWLGVEVTGTLKLEETDRAEALAVDVRQLPWEMVQSAVSPILRAWRYHSGEARVELRATRLPDVEPQSASVDSVVADTVLSPEGRELSDVRITLRNRLRHSLRVTLPAGAEVRSALLDGEPIKPSIAADGALLLPLKRSAEGPGGLAPFTVQVILERQGEAPGLFGRLDLALPAVELPVSSLSWSAWVPARSDYTALRGEVEAQVRTGSGQWYQAPVVATATTAPVGAIAGEAASADTGAMPVKIELPRTGTRLSMARYWVEGGEAVTGSTWHWRGWLVAPLVSLLCLLLGGGIVVAGHRPVQPRWAAAGGGALLAGLALVLSGPGPVVATVLLAGLVLAGTHGLHRLLLPAARAWWATETGPTAWAGRSVIGRLALLGASAFVGLVVLITTLRWLSLVDQPL